MNTHVDEFVKLLEVYGRSPKTITGYVQGLGWFANAHKGIRPKDITIQHIIDYLHTLHKKGQGPDHINNQTAAIKFYFKNVLDKKWDFMKIPYKKRKKRLPTVLEPELIDRLIHCAENIKHKAILATLYSTGVRPRELSLLKLADINSEANTIHIIHGKGDKDRHVMLPQNLRDVLEAYLITVQDYKSEYLFFGINPDKPMDPETFGAIFRRTKIKAGITEKSCCYSLRHSFATHSLEQGVDIRTIQEVMGHTSISTTCIYLRIAKKRIAQTLSPFDSIPIFNKNRRHYV